MVTTGMRTSTRCTLVKRENVLVINAHKLFIWKWVFTESDFRDVDSVSSPGEPDPIITTTSITTDIEIIPITLNYKYECELSDKLNWYAGAGAGIALVDVDIETSVSGDNGGPTSESDDDTAFYGHIFAGLVYNVSDTIEVFGGARYIFMDDVLGGDSPLDEEVHYRARCPLQLLVYRQQSILSTRMAFTVRVFYDVSLSLLRSASQQIQTIIR